MQACTQWTHSDVWSQLATTPECLFQIGDGQSEKKRWSEGDMPRNAWYSRWARANPPPGCHSRIRRSASTLTQPFRPDGNVFCWCCLQSDGHIICYQSRKGTNIMEPSGQGVVCLNLQFFCLVHRMPLRISKDISIMLSGRPWTTWCPPSWEIYWSTVIQMKNMSNTISG